MKYTVSKHAQKAMVRRGIFIDVVNTIIEKPDQIVEEYDQKKHISQ